MSELTDLHPFASIMMPNGIFVLGKYILNEMQVWVKKLLGIVIRSQSLPKKLLEREVSPTPISIMLIEATSLEGTCE